MVWHKDGKPRRVEVIEPAREELVEMIEKPPRPMIDQLLCKVRIIESGEIAYVRLGELTHSSLGFKL